MSRTEFDLIRQYFQGATPEAGDVRCGIGDDAAIVTVPPGRELVITMDTLVAGVHFPEGSSADDIGYKALAVNLSDLAAMGATPRWVTLSLTLPESDEEWIGAFMDGFQTLARGHAINLIGGDLTHGPLSITVQAHGLVPEGMAIRRSGASPGDKIFVSGTPGDAALALAMSSQRQADVDEKYREGLMARLNRPVPRVHLGEKLRGIASAAIDISDGVAADLGHILEASRAGAVVSLPQLPLSGALGQLPQEQAWQYALTGGDDYELCFTLPPDQFDSIEGISTPDCPLTVIGEITDARTLSFQTADGSEFVLEKEGYRHF